MIETESLYRDAGFVLSGSDEVDDYAPRAVDVVKVQGIEITQLEDDEAGLLGGMEVDVDVDLLGTPVRNSSGLSAIEYTDSTDETGQPDAGRDTGIEPPFDTGTVNSDTGSGEAEADCGGMNPGRRSPLGLRIGLLVLGRAGARRRT